MVDLEEDKMDPDQMEEDAEAVEIMQKSQGKFTQKAVAGGINSVGNSP